MATIKVEMLQNIAVLIGDTDVKRAERLAADLREFGFAPPIIAGSFNDVGVTLEKGEIDVAILADSLGGRVFKLIRGVRHGLLGSNPFMVLYCALAPEHIDGAKHALRAGVDSILIQPVPAKEIADRVRKAGRTDIAFVVTSEYIGPDRRAADRASAIRRFYVPQTVQAKLRGQNLNYKDYAKKIAPILEDMMQTRLSSQSARLSSVCKELVATYQSGQITPVVKDKLKSLDELLRDASGTAKQLGQDDVAILCLSLADKIKDFGERYTTPTQKDMDLLGKLAEAVAMAARTGVAVDSKVTGLSAHEQEEQALPADELGPALEIRFLKRGQQLFQEGDEAASAYVVASGCIGIFRKVDGRPSPVARIRSGEFFGEMAILDGSARRATAVALEDTTVSLVSKEHLEEKMAGTDKLIRTILLSAVHNLRTAHDTYTQRGRSLKDLFDTLNLSSHITGRHAERVDLDDDKDVFGDLLADFDATLEDLLTLSAPAIKEDRRDDQILNSDDIQEAAD